MKNKKRILIAISLCATLAASDGAFGIVPLDAVGIDNEDLECFGRDKLHCPSQSSKRSTASQSPILPELSSTEEVFEESESFSSMSPVLQEERKISLDFFKILVEDLSGKIDQMEESYKPVCAIGYDSYNRVIALQKLRRNQKILGVTMATGFVASLPLAIQLVPQFRFQFEHLPTVADFRTIDSIALLHTAMPFILVGGLMAFGHHLWTGNSRIERHLLEEVKSDIDVALSTINRTGIQVADLRAHNSAMEKKLQGIDRTLNSVEVLAERIKDSSSDTANLAQTIELVLKRQQALYDRQERDLKAMQMLIAAIKKNNLAHVLENLSREEQVLVSQIETEQPLTLEQDSQSDRLKKSKGFLHWASKRLGFANKDTEHSTTV